MMIIIHDIHSVILRGDHMERTALCPDVPPKWRFEYILGEIEPNYPLPALSGEVIWDYWPAWDNGEEDAFLEIIITDCDERSDPRLCITVYIDHARTDYPHCSPNYR